MVILNILHFFEQAKWELHWMEEEQKEFISSYQGNDPTMDMLYTDIEIKARKRYNKDYLKME